MDLKEFMRPNKHKIIIFILVSVMFYLLIQFVLYGIVGFRFFFPFNIPHSAENLIGSYYQAIQTKNIFTRFIPGLYYGQTGKMPGLYYGRRGTSLLASITDSITNNNSIYISYISLANLLVLFSLYMISSLIYFKFIRKESLRFAVDFIKPNRIKIIIFLFALFFLNVLLFSSILLTQVLPAPGIDFYIPIHYHNHHFHEMFIPGILHYSNDACNGFYCDFRDFFLISVFSLSSFIILSYLYIFSCFISLNSPTRNFLNYLKRKIATKVNCIKLTISILIPLVIGFIGYLFNSVFSDKFWYIRLNKPSFTPTNDFFAPFRTGNSSFHWAPVWIILYILMGISFYLVWTRGLGNNKLLAKGIFYLNLLLSLSWSLLFFSLTNPLFALIDILILLLVILANIIIFHKISKPAGILLIPYFLWIFFVSIINYLICVMN